MNFASQNLAKISTPIYVYLYLMKTSVLFIVMKSKIAKLSPHKFPHLVQNRENMYAKILVYTVVDFSVVLQPYSLGAVECSF